MRSEKTNEKNGNNKWPPVVFKRTVTVNGLAMAVVIVVDFELSDEISDSSDALLHGIQILCKIGQCRVLDQLALKLTQKHVRTRLGMIGSGRLRSVLAGKVESDGFDSESAHFIVEAKSVGTSGRGRQMVVSFLSSFKVESLPDHLTRKFDLGRASRVKLQKSHTVSNLCKLAEPKWRGACDK